MEREAFFTGYCRQTDGGRTVGVEAEGEALTYADCAYETCPYRDDCPVGKNITDFLKKQ